MSPKVLSRTLLVRAVHETAFAMCYSQRGREDEVSRTNFIWTCRFLSILTLHQRPSSKTHIRELEHRIKSLERQLRKAEELAERNLYLMPPNANEANEPVHLTTNGDLEESVNMTNPAEIPPSPIARLCAKQSHFHTDEVGQVRFFGQTSSLHTTEKVSSTFVQWDDSTFKTDAADQQDISPLLRDHLLEQYWKCKLRSCCPMAES